MATAHFLTFVSLFGYGLAVPPSICFDNFNWDDCGRPPVHVLYYYKPGSRCEVGVWRGCPNQNMFKDEYECINTCIYVERAQAVDFHQVMKGMKPSSDEAGLNETDGITVDTTDTVATTTDVANVTDTAAADNATSSVSSVKANETSVSENPVETTTPDAQNVTVTTANVNGTGGATNTTN